MLTKFGSKLQIIASSSTLEDLVTEKSKPTILEAKQSDFLYFRSRAISALETSGPNGNGDAFPRKELEASYQSFIGRNLFLNHESDHPIKSIGKIVDAYAIDDPETGEFYIECLSKIDKKLHPEIARKVETGELNTVSMGCFIAGTPVLMGNGEYKAIEDIKQNDLIINHLGTTDKVTNTFKKFYQDLIYKVSLKGLFGLPLNVTEEHPFWVIKKENITKKLEPVLVISENKSAQIAYKTNNIFCSDSNKFEWVPASELRPGDYVAFTYPQKIETPSYVTKDFARLFGYYLSEGNLCYETHAREGKVPVKVFFTININEIEYRDEIVSLIKNVTGKNPRIYTKVKKQCINIAIHDRKLSNLFLQLGKSLAKHKSLNESVWYWDPKLQLELLGAFINGDGCFTEFEDTKRNIKTPRVYLETASYNLANQFCWFLSRNQILWSLEKKEYSDHTAHFQEGDKNIKASTTYRICISGKNLNTLKSVTNKIPVNTKFRLGETFSQKKFFLNNYVMIPISGIETSEYSDYVYNLEVENRNSYVASGIAVHNCGCSESMCSICGIKVYSDADEKCEHLSSYGLLKEYDAKIDLPEYGIVRGNKAKAFSINSGLTFNELSIVNVPADSRAIIKTVIANFRNQLSKKASLNKEEQLEIINSLDTILSTLDEKTREQVKTELCSCAPFKETSNTMSKEKSQNNDIKVEAKTPSTPQDEVNSILRKLDGYEYIRLMSHLEKKEAKALAAIPEQSTKAEEKIASTDDSKLQKIFDKVMKTFAGKIFSQAVKRVASEEASSSSDDNTKEIYWQIKEYVDFQEHVEGHTHQEAIEMASAKFKISISEVNNALSSKEASSSSDDNNKADSIEDKEDLAENRNTPPEVLTQLSKDKDPNIRYAVAYNPNTPSEVLTQLSKDRDSDIRWNVASNPKTPTEVLLRLSKDEEEEVRRAVAGNLKTPPEALTQLSKDRDPNVRLNVAYNPKTPPEVLTQLSKDKDYDVRYYVAGNPNTPPEVKKQLRRDASEIQNTETNKLSEKSKISAKFNKNDDLSQSSWSILSDDKVIVSATLKDIWGDELETNKEWAISDEYGTELVARFESEGLEKTAELLGIEADSYEDKGDLAKNPKTSPEVLTQLSKNTESIIREYVAENPNTPPEVLTQLSKDEDLRVRHNVARNPNTPPEVKKQLRRTEIEGTETAETDPLKLEANTPSDKSAEDFNKVTDEAEVGDHLESSKPREDRKEGKKVNMSTIEASAFDKVEKIMLEDNHTAVKDKETNEIVITDGEGKEVKRLPDGFGDDIPNVMNLLNSILGLPAEDEMPKDDVTPKMEPEVLKEEPKVDLKIEEVPAAAPLIDDTASKKIDELNKKASELQKKEEELLKLEAKVNANKFSSVLNARTEKCKLVIEAMVDKEMLAIDDAELSVELETGIPMLEARKKAFEKAVNRQLKTLLAMDDTSLKAFAESVSKVKKQASKKLSKPFNLTLPQETGFEDDINHIFSSMGTLKGSKQ